MMYKGAVAPKQPYPMAGIHALHGIAAKSCFCFPCLWQSKQILLKMRKKSPSQLRSLDRYCDGTF
jgi:hypothetical protein